ncbi:pappalysin-1 [Fistulifera solaris]|uniref:Pappalysin-1 n=1 Tax=Fistulifera solaris TaxID=1519565 RepID=A0A1Z5KSE9_FISSO|nr:pappalysin-1 [Fistulifera solaris]|eukprot:GAX28858.1 pappalysin-1 [Fistulifera solaris]
MKLPGYALLLFALTACFSKIQEVSSHGSHGWQDDRDLETTIERCDTAEAKEADIATQQLVVEKFLSSPDEVDIEANIMIPVCFYVISDDTGKNKLSNGDLQRQLDALNTAYGSSSCCNTTLSWCAPGTCSIKTGIQFAVAKVNANGVLVPGATVRDVSTSGACVFHVVNNVWAYLDSGDEMEMKTALKKGDAKTLDVYFTDLRALGFTFYPWAVTPGSIKDGVVVKASSIPGGTNTRYNEGDTLVHEVGHWLGLSHTFSGGCDISDGIADTPPQGNAYGGCSPATRPDTCPGGGPDPIFNFMDYSLDACMYEFTLGQALAMRACYTYFRRGRWENDIIDLQFGEQSDPFNLIPRERQVFRYMIQGNTTCTISANEGNADMYMNLLSPPSWSSADLCVKSNLGSAESCSTGAFSANEFVQEPTKENETGLFRLLIRTLAGLLRRAFADVEDPAPVPSQSPTQSPVQQWTEPVLLYVGVLAVGSTPVQNASVLCK